LDWGNTWKVDSLICFDSPQWLVNGAYVLEPLDKGNLLKNNLLVRHYFIFFLENKGFN
jgi:hypothetical protein